MYKYIYIYNYIYIYIYIQHNPAISNSLISKFCFYRSSIGSPTRHDVN